MGIDFYLWEMADIQKKIEGYQTQLAYYGKLVVERGLTYSVFGNISARLENGMVIKKKGVNLEFAHPDDFIFVSLDRTPSPSIRTQLSSEWRLHRNCYLTGCKYNAVFHLHPFYISLLDELNIPLDCKDMEFDYFLKNKVAYLEYFPPGSYKLARNVAGYICNYPFLILKGHGIVVAGPTIQEVYNLALTAEVIARRIFFKKLFSK